MANLGASFTERNYEKMLDDVSPDAPEPAAPGLSGAGLLAATIAAHGGGAFLHLASFTFTGTGTFTTPPQTGSVSVPVTKLVYHVAAGGRSHLTAQGDGMTFVVVVRGWGKGGYFTLAGRRLDLAPDQTTPLVLHGYLINAVQQGYAVTVPRDIAPETDDDGKPLLAYRIHHSETQTMTVWVEPDTRLVRKTVCVTSRGEFTDRYGDYRRVSGIPMFHTMQVLENGENVILKHADTVTINAPLDDKLFE